ncbi:MAG: hypothetical protein L6R42_005512 [Xanthoria sp. 1 TBL-2021]|nr:MAG: hypothetical protein L6R42_005512 [Xanthoria sp. 1 TBL-2021]
MDTSGNKGNAGLQGTRKGKGKAQTIEDGRQDDGMLYQPSMIQNVMTRGFTSNDVDGSSVTAREVRFPGKDGTTTHPPRQGNTDRGGDSRSASSLEVVLAKPPLKVQSIVDTSTFTKYFPHGRLLSMFLMSIHVPHKGPNNNSATIDTCSHFNLIKRRKAMKLGLNLEEYEGTHILPFGPKILPKSQVTFGWNVLKNSGPIEPIYQDTFIIVEDAESRHMCFDILMCEEQIDHIGIFKNDHTVFNVKHPGDVSIFHVDY